MISVEDWITIRNLKKRNPKWEQGQFDWSPYTVMIEGKLIKIQVFCLILGCSRYQTYMYSYPRPNHLCLKH